MTVRPCAGYSTTKLRWLITERMLSTHYRHGVFSPQLSTTVQYVSKQLSAVIKTMSLLIFPKYDVHQATIKTQKGISDTHECTLVWFRNIKVMMRASDH